LVVPVVTAIYNFGTEFKRSGKWRMNLFFTLCVGTRPIAYYTNQRAATQRNINLKT